MKKIITTVGTSLFTNYMMPEIQDCLEDYIGIEEEFEKLKYIPVKSYNDHKYRNYKKKLEKTICEKWLKGIEKINGNWQATDLGKFNHDASAEITSLIKIFNLLNDEDISIILFSSDTILSYLAAEIIKKNIDWTNNIDIKIINGLTIQNRTTFIKEGLKNLFERLEEVHNNSYDDIILNITGGYKATIPYMTIWGQIYNNDIYYIFEDSDELISIPQMPINIDFGLFEKYSNIFIKLDNVVSSSKEEFLTENDLKYDKDFPKNLILEERDGDESLLFLDPSAQILWKRYNNLITIKIVGKSKYFDYKNKKEIERAFSTLYHRLKEADNFETLKDDKLKHLGIKDTWIYKYNNNDNQIRIQYQWKDNTLTIFNFKFINSKSDDKKYSKEMEEEYENIKNKKIEIIKI